MPPNWANRTMWTGDNLDIMRGMNSESVDLIYLDPPFNSNRVTTVPRLARRRRGPRSRTPGRSTMWTWRGTGRLRNKTPPSTR